MNPNELPPKKRAKSEEWRLLEAMESSIHALSLKLTLTEAAARDLKDEHNRTISSANRRFSELLMRGRPSAQHSEMLHQLELRCMRLEGENASLAAAREREGLRLKELERANAARERAWAGLDPSEIRLIIQYERQAFEASPDACVQRRLEMRYNREAIEQNRKACAERIQRAEEQLAAIPRMEERMLAAEAKAAHTEQQWLVLRGRVQGCEAETTLARSKLADLTAELLCAVDAHRSTEARLAATLGRAETLEADVGSKRAELNSLRTTGAGAAMLQECAKQMERMRDEHGAELEALKGRLGAKINDLKRRLDASAHRCRDLEAKLTSSESRGGQHSCNAGGRPP